MKNLKKVMGMALILALSACTAAPKNGLPDTSKTSSPQTEVREETTDVVVIGAGGAGLTAAYFVKQGGKDVVLLEKRAMTGGNTALAGFFAANSTKMQEAMGDTYTQQDQIDFLMETEGTDPDFARLFAENSGPTAEWAVDTLGIEVTRVNGREIYAVDEKGTKFPAQFVSKLTALNQQIGVDLRTECPAVSLIIEDGKITGVEAEDAQGKVLFHAQAVILASGGFAANQEMLQEYVPEWAGGTTSNTAATTGDGIRMAQAIGAAVSNMDQRSMMIREQRCQSAAFATKAGFWWIRPGNVLPMKWRIIQKFRKQKRRLVRMPLRLWMLRRWPVILNMRLKRSRLKNWRRRLGLIRQP